MLNAQSSCESDHTVCRDDPMAAFRSFFSQQQMSRNSCTKSFACAVLVAGLVLACGSSWRAISAGEPWNLRAGVVSGRGWDYPISLFALSMDFSENPKPTQGNRSRRAGFIWRAPYFRLASPLSHHRVQCLGDRILTDQSQPTRYPTSW